MKKLFLILKIMRPFNLLLSCLSVIMVAFLCNLLSFPIFFHTILVVFCFGAASNMLNDIIDVAIDRFNKPKRVMPMGLLNTKLTIILSFFIYGIGIMSTFFLQPLGQYIALCIILPLLILYTPILKPIPLVGNIIIGGIIGSVFLFSEAALTDNIDIMWIPFFLATALSFIREICKDAEDLIGDAALHIKTFPVVFGLNSTLQILMGFSICFCFCAFIPYLNTYYGLLYIVLIICFIEIPLLYGVFVIINKHSNALQYSNLSKLLKGITIMGIITIFLSNLIRI